MGLYFACFDALMFMDNVISGASGEGFPLASNEFFIVASSDRVGSKTSMGNSPEKFADIFELLIVIPTGNGGTQLFISILALI